VAGGVALVFDVAELVHAADLMRRPALCMDFRDEGPRKAGSGEAPS
jgi:hypothetical protein